ncbi:YeeE/YedE family protein [Candidatus Methylocalor cossyra]|uniref:YeeE/YedE family protein n=1 Tax=Candidatus Methylocalor cossyra TaxID=3108543 RepID=A0ABP1CAI9_9GAMM
MARSERAAGFASAFLCGWLFALGLGIAGMTRPSRIIAFLDITGRWDSSLLWVMIGAVTVGGLLFPAVLRRPRPVWAERFQVPENRTVDRPLLTGAALFGVGWGLAGYCPGPAVVALATPNPASGVFVLALLLGLGLGKRVFHVMNTIVLAYRTLKDRALSPFRGATRRLQQEALAEWRAVLEQAPEHRRQAPFQDYVRRIAYAMVLQANQGLGDRCRGRNRLALPRPYITALAGPAYVWLPEVYLEHAYYCGWCHHDQGQDAIDRALERVFFEVLGELRAPPENYRPPHHYLAAGYQDPFRPQATDHLPPPRSAA